MELKAEIAGNLQGWLGNDRHVQGWNSILRKAVNTFWFWRNAIYHESDEEIPRGQQAVKVIISRILDWQDAFARRLLRSFRNPKNGEVAI